jgi:hypothetical protein
MIPAMPRALGAKASLLPGLAILAILLAGCGSSKHAAVSTSATMPSAAAAQRTLETAAVELVAQESEGHTLSNAQVLADSQELVTILTYYSPDMTPGQKQAQVEAAITAVRSVCTPCVALFQRAFPAK